MNPVTVTINTTLIIAITCMIIGFVTGGFIGYFNKDKRKKEEKSSNTVAPAAPAVETPAILADPAKYTELLRLWRAKEGAGLYVETSGHLLASSKPLNSSQKSRFIDLIKELAIWLDIPAAELLPNHTASPSISDQQEPDAQLLSKEKEPVIVESPDNPPLIKASEPIKTDPLPPVPPPVISNPTVAVQSQTPPVVRPAVVPAPPRPQPETVKKPAASMVEQIDEILQEIIQLSDDPTRQIKLMESRQDGVIVWVGQEHFPGIDAVTDPKAKELIRAAAREWERRAENHI